VEQWAHNLLKGKKIMFIVDGHMMIDNVAVHGQIEERLSMWG
jgi:hypothetical protein